jgi:chromosomal replication initiator protein
MVCRLETPDFATRHQLVKQYATALKGNFSPEALEFVARRFQNNFRELEGAVNCLQTYFSMTKKRITGSTARRVLADLERDCIRIIRLDDIEQAVCNLFKLQPKDLKSARRLRSISQPRMLAMFLARKHTQAAYSEIGQFFGGRNHSTVMSAEKKVRSWIAQRQPIEVSTQEWLAHDLVEAIEQQLLAS